MGVYLIRDSLRRAFARLRLKSDFVVMVRATLPLCLLVAFANSLIQKKLVIYLSRRYRIAIIRQTGDAALMWKQFSALRDAFTSATFGALVVYALYRLLAYESYTTNFGLCVDPFAYVSNISFMTGAALGNLISCILIFVLYASGRIRACTLGYRSPLIIIAFVYIMTACIPAAQLSQMLTSTFLGILWGLTIAIAGLSALELLVGTTSRIVLIVQIIASLFLFALGSYILSFLPGSVVAVVCAIISLAMIPLMPTLRSKLDIPSGPDSHEVLATFRKTLGESATPILAVAFFELVVGLVNMYAFESHSSFTISNNAPLEGSVICAILASLFVVVAARVPNGKFVMLGVFPGVISVFLALPYFGDVWGRPLSTVIYTAYIFTATLSTYSVVRACRRANDCVYGIGAVLSIAMRVCLLIGLAIGWWCGNLKEGDTFVHLSIVCVVCVYVLGMVVLLWGYRNLREKSAPKVVEVVVEREPETFAQAQAERIEELVSTYELSPRERDVLIGLAQGNTAASIARGLHISTSTAQGYIKTLYVKLGVNKKQQVIDLFQR